MRSNSYYMLICSLPALPTRFDAERLPITLERLQARLHMLEPRDAADVGRMLEVINWSCQFAEARDSAVVKRYEELMQAIANPLIREVLAAGLDMQMIIAALRRRRRGLGPPTLGIGQWLDHIRRHFGQADFALGRTYPWLVPFDQLLERGDVLTLHRRMLMEAWDLMRKLAQDYDIFSFEAVVLYIARWDLIRTWRQLDPERGRNVFEPLVTEAMGEYAEHYA